MTRRRRANPGDRELARERFQVPYITTREKAPALQRTADVVPGVLRKIGLESALAEHELVGEWSALAGDQVARHTRPGRLAQGVLTVFVRHSTWLHELSRYGSVTLLERIQARFGEKRIRRLRLQLDPEPPPATDPGKSPLR